MIHFQMVTKKGSNYSFHDQKVFKLLKLVLDYQSKYFPNLIKYVGLRDAFFKTRSAFTNKKYSLQQTQILRSSKHNQFAFFHFMPD